MKKNIIIAAIAAASALLLFVSCQKENQPESQNRINAGAKTFTATIEQSLTKTTLTDANKVNWTSTDKISINGKIYIASPKDDDATKADFTAEDGEATPDGSNKFKAIYPSTLYKTDHFELPATQTYTADQFNAPMYAESETQTLSFKNICAVLAINVTSDDITTLKSIKVKADKKLNGTFTVASTTAGYKAEIETDGTDEVVLFSDAAINLTSEGTTFYIAIPEQTYSYLKIYLSEDGSTYNRAMITKKTVGAVSCNKIYNITYETNAVQLYADGPYWSTMNIGATAETDFGLYFGWGEKTGHALATAGPFTGGIINNAFEGNYSFSKNPVIGEATDDQNPSVLPPSNDAAYVNWGASWKMPTKQDFTDLANACRSEEYISGNFSSSNANTAVDVNTMGVYYCSNYSSGDGIKGLLFCNGTNKLFFPAAGYSLGANLTAAGSDCGYWSSSLNTDNTGYAYYLYFNHGTVYPQYSFSRSSGFSVRPVSD